MECPRCHNQNNAYFYKVNGRYYCRHCISFQRVYVDEQHDIVKRVYPSRQVHYHLDFELSSRQTDISYQLVDNYKNNHNSYVWAVCGSGKTEIVYEVIAYALSHGDRVCFCVPRKELVQELYQRIKVAFKDEEIGLLYGGVKENEDAQLIVCTMHQLYRFERNGDGFSLMICDEIDAFPFYGNEVLNQMVNQCCQGNFIKMSATISEKDIVGGKLLMMNRRYHAHDLPVPQLILCPDFMQLFLALIMIKVMHKQVLVFVPSITCIDKALNFFRFFHITCDGVCSKFKDNQKKIDAFKQKQLQVLVTTTLLERGITIEDVQVIVLQSDHQVFDERTLIQIAGRVGRKPNHPKGHVYLYSHTKTKEITKCIQTIKKLNRIV